MHDDCFKPLRDFYSRFGRRDRERMGAHDADEAVRTTDRPVHDRDSRYELRDPPLLGPVDASRRRSRQALGPDHVARGLDGFMNKAASGGSNEGPAIRRAGCLGLVLAALTHASGCGPECDVDRYFTLLLDLVDESDVRLDMEELAAAAETARIEVCVLDGIDSRCFKRRPEELLRGQRMLELSHSDLAYPDRRRCQFPSVRFSVEIPGCDPAEFVLAGEEVTDHARFDDHTELLTIVCPGA
ncbi:hypothetical protein [Nannocystis pusilla]|uniref:hypothetical protein n=1 Tax=Nannocystis pusilla TaxID=889268 RepID=UPI003DA1E6C2